MRSSCALREAARRLGTAQLGDVTVFATLEPCAMCVGALLASDVTELVYAVPNRTDGAAGTVLQLAQHPGLARRLQVVSGIRRAEAEELLDGAVRSPPSRARSPDRLRDHRPRRVRPGASGILSRGEVSEWLMVPLSKSGVRKHRGFESRPLRQKPQASVGQLASRLRSDGLPATSVSGAGYGGDASTPAVDRPELRRGRLVA